MIGTYPPTRCGIATFTADVEQALTEAGVTVSVLVVDPDHTLRVGRLPTIVSNDRASYAAAAQWLNSSGIDLVLVEHEFGIHGGADGGHLLELTEHLTIPYVVTLHTVLTRFTATQSAILDSLCARAAGITVFTATARQMIVEQELAASASITIVPHGAPIELYRSVGRSLRDELGLAEGAPVLSTFGLLSPGKGIEIAITAMRQIVDCVPDARYVIAGRTHPGVQRSGGERYRADLQRLTEALRLEEHVHFVDRFLTVEEIAELLSWTTVFLTPYRNADQIVSGVLTFAIAAGCPVVTTPYRYGCDMVADGAGMIVPFNDPDAFARASLTLMTDGAPRTHALDVAKAVSATLSWPAVGRTLAQVLAVALARSRPTRAPVADVAPSSAHLLG
ncbi:MAG: glycosyltransferase, partial [Ilumatobacteraceae bacterium]